MLRHPCVSPRRQFIKVETEMSDFRFHVATIESMTTQAILQLRNPQSAKDPIHERIGLFLEAMQSVLHELEQHQDFLHYGTIGISMTPVAFDEKVEANPSVDQDIESITRCAADLLTAVLSVAMNGSRMSESKPGITEEPVLPRANQMATDLTSGLMFKVSQDEEHTRLWWSDGRRQFDLGERTHHYSLLTLARLRIADSNRGFDRETQGWVDVEQLATMLGIEPRHLNIHIYRLRMQLASLSTDNSQPPALIERRRGSVRISAQSILIWRGERLEASFDPSATASI